MQIGSKVMIPRTGGYDSEGEVIEMYSTHARVRFPIGDTFRGRRAPEQVKSQYGYKTLKQSELKIID